jgi:hypothetical protein
VGRCGPKHACQRRVRRSLRSGASLLHRKASARAASQTVSQESVGLSATARAVSFGLDSASQCSSVNVVLGQSGSGSASGALCPEHPDWLAETGNIAEPDLLSSVADGDDCAAHQPVKLSPVSARRSSRAGFRWRCVRGFRRHRAAHPRAPIGHGNQTWM